MPNPANSRDFARAAWILTGEAAVGPEPQVELAQAVSLIVGSPAFRARVLWALSAGDVHGRLLGQRLDGLELWAAATLPLTPTGRMRVEGCASRGDLLQVVLADEEFRGLVGPAIGREWDASLAGADERLSAGTPTIALLSLVRDHEPSVVDAFARSVLALQQDDWELCLCDHGSESVRTQYALDRLRGADARVRLRAVSADATEAQAYAAAAVAGSATWVWPVSLQTPLSVEALSTASGRGLRLRATMLTPG